MCYLRKKCFSHLFFLRVSGNEHSNYKLIPLFLSHEMCFSVLISIGLGQKLSLHLWILIACCNKQVDKLWKWLTQLHHTVSILTVSLWFHFFLIAISMYNVRLFPLCSPFSRHYSVVLSKMVFRPCLLGPPTLPNIFIHNASNQNYILYLLFNV